MENSCPKKEEVTRAISILGGNCIKHCHLRDALIILLVSWLAVFPPSARVSHAQSPDNQERSYRVLDISRIPNPKESAYPDCLTHILCQPLNKPGEIEGGKVDLVFYAYRKRFLYPASDLKPGDEISVKTIPFQEAPQKIRNLQQVNDLPYSDAPILFVSGWDRQDKFEHRLADSQSILVPTSSNRDLIIQTLISHQGNVTGGVIEDFFFWSHLPEMYEIDFWKKHPNRKNATGPLKGIQLFKQHLESKGIKLIFVPIPRSTTIYPDIATNIEYDPDIDGRINFAVRDFMNALEAEDVICVDLTPAFLENAYQDYNGKAYPIYRRNDVHWSPSGVRIAARLIAEAIQQQPEFEKLTTRNTSATFKETITMESLPFSMPEIKRQPSRRKPLDKHPVYSVKGGIESDQAILNENLRDAEIHLLGDSFSNIYGAGPGQAGLHPHLVKELKTPINKIASAAGGAAISPDRFARNIDHSKVKIVIWAVAESFLAAPDIWSDIPLDRPDTLMLDKRLADAHLSHNDFASHLPEGNIQGSYIAIGDPENPDTLPVESRMLWKNIRIADKSKSPTFSVSTWIKDANKANDQLHSEKYPISWEIWINGSLYKSQSSPSDRGIFQRRKWQAKLDKFSGQVIDIELVCRRSYPNQSLPGHPCWILPEIKGAVITTTDSTHANTDPDTPVQPFLDNNSTRKSSYKEPERPLNRSLIGIVIILLIAMGCSAVYLIGKKK